MYFVQHSQIQASSMENLIDSAYRGLQLSRAGGKAGVLGTLDSLSSLLDTKQVSPCDPPRSDDDLCLQEMQEGELRPETEAELEAVYQVRVCTLFTVSCTLPRWCPGWGRTVDSELSPWQQPSVSP